MRKITKKLSIFFLSGTMIFTPAIMSIDDNAIISEAHSGRTDSSGGHHDNKNKSGLGSYHYHCGGNPAHLHDGGICPYSSSAAATDTATNITPSLSASESTNSTAAITGGSRKVTLHNQSTISLSSELIKLVQDVLTQKGYDCGSIDGVAGEKTKTAISDFLKGETEESSDKLIIQMIADSMELSSAK